MAPSVLQTAGFFLGVIGSAALIAATAMNQWSVADRQSDVITSTYTFKGLWKDCETSAAGMTECRPYYGLMGYSGSFQAVRALMIVGVVLSVLGAVISVFSLQCLTMNSMSETSKAKMSLTAGIMFIIGGICGIAAASLYANQIVASFRMATINQNNYGGGGYGGYGGGMGQGMGMGGMGMGGMVPRYTFGAALFVAWIGGGILLVGGVLKSLAFKGMVQDDKTRYPGVAYKSHANSKPDHDVHHSEETRSRPDQKYV